MPRARGTRAGLLRAAAPRPSRCQRGAPVGSPHPRLGAHPGAARRLRFVRADPGWRGVRDPQDTAGCPPPGSPRHRRDRAWGSSVPRGRAQPLGAPPRPLPVGARTPGAPLYLRAPLRPRQSAKSCRRTDGQEDSRTGVQGERRGSRPGPAPGGLLRAGAVAPALVGASGRGQGPAAGRELRGQRRGAPAPGSRGQSPRGGGPGLPSPPSPSLPGTAPPCPGPARPAGSPPHQPPQEAKRGHH